MLAWLPEQVSSGPPASALATVSAHWAMQALIAAWSTLVGQCPTPRVSARPHLTERLVSHLPKSGVPPPTFATPAFAYNRQEPYRPVVLSLLDSHRPPVPPAHALAPRSNTPAERAEIAFITVLRLRGWTDLW